jgi:hypothetical protein
MRFHLSYEGPLLSSGNDDPTNPRPHKLKAVWEIRNHIEPQLEMLFKTHPALHPRSPEGRVLLHELIPSIMVGEHAFCPLARSRFGVKCGLEITMQVKPRHPVRTYESGGPR